MARHWASFAFRTSLGGLGVLLSSAIAWGAGVLVPRDGSAPIAIQSHRVTARIEDGLARTTVRQVFVNPHPRMLEAIYSFPLPENAAIVELTMIVAGQRLEGLLAERRKARQIYDDLVKKAIDPALLEKTGRSEYRLSVFPVAPKIETVIELTYVEPTPVVGGEMRYVYPLALQSNATQGGAAQTLCDLTATIGVSSSVRIVGLESPTQGMSTTLLSAREGRASFERTQARLDSDLVVVARIASAEPGLRVHTYRAPGGDAFFAAVITPPELDADSLIPRDFTFVLDTSGSMQGEKLAQAKRAATWWIERLGPKDRANLILFSDVTSRFAQAPVDATPENRAALSKFVADAVDRGGTDLASAVALAGEHRSSGDRLAVSVLLTDGRPTIGVTDTAAIVGSARASGDSGASIHAFGIGDDVDPILLDAIASAANGSSEVIRTVGDVEERLRSFFLRIGAPAMRGATLRIGDRVVDDSTPKGPFTAFRGEQMVITGRFRAGGPQSVTLDAVVDSAPIELRAMADFGSSTAGLATGSIVARDLYAQKRIRSLERAHRLRIGLDDAAYHAAVDAGKYDTTDELIAAMIDVSLETGVQCAYTSFLALLPEDRTSLNGRNGDALDAALKRVAERRRVLAKSDDPPNRPHRDSDATTDPKEPEVLAEIAEEIEEGITEVFDSVVEPSTQAATTSSTYGGKYGRRGGGKGGGRASMRTVDLGLEWLKRHQNSAGSWSAATFDANCEKNKCSGAGDPALDVRVTALALLSFLGGGNSPNSGKYKQSVSKGLNWLVDSQDRTSGLLVRAETHERFGIDHALATFALSEGYSARRLPHLKEPTELGIRWLQSQRVKGSGWRRSGATEGECDLSMTTYSLLALLSARDFGLAHDPIAIFEAHEWLKSRAVSDAPLENAMVLLCRLLLDDEPTDPALRLLADAVHAEVQAKWADRNAVDPEFAYFACYAMVQMGGTDWNRMEVRCLESMVKAQVTGAGDEMGSFPGFARAPSEPSGGRVETTAYFTLCVQAYYHYDRILGARSAPAKVRR